MPIEIKKVSSPSEDMKQYLEQQQIQRQALKLKRSSLLSGSSSTLGEGNLHNPVNDEDDDSVSSTVAATDVNTKCISYDTETSSSQQKGSIANAVLRVQKHVIFHLESNQEYESIISGPEGKAYLKQHCWYSAMDYRGFKQQTDYLSRQIIHQERKNWCSPLSYERVMEQTYQACCKPTFVSYRHEYCSQQNIDNNRCSSSNNNNSNNADREWHDYYSDYQFEWNDSIRRSMFRWAALTPARLGLEYRSLRSVAGDRALRRQELMTLVHTLQQTQQERLYTAAAADDDDDNSDSDSDSDIHDDPIKDMAECMRRNCQRITQPSRRFAHCLALAQAAALEQDCLFS